jgi:class 3 adenylate cyclase
MLRDQRRLAAIVSADVAGYSRLMGRDESGTLAALKAHRRELIDPKIAESSGYAAWLLLCRCRANLALGQYDDAAVACDSSLRAADREASLSGSAQGWHPRAIRLAQ